MSERDLHMLVATTSEGDAATRVCHYQHAYAALAPTPTELAYAFARSGDHADAPASCCSRDCEARHAALRILRDGSP